MPHLAGLCDTSQRASPATVCASLERLLAVRGMTYVMHRWSNRQFGAVNMVLPDAAARCAPVAGADGEHVLFLDGALYNERALHPLVEARDLVPFQDSGRLCLKLFEKFGPAFVDRLNGQFNLVIYNTRTRRVLLMNDRMAYRPFFYSTANRRLVFACEQKAVLAASGVPRAFDRRGVLQLFAFGHQLDDTTCFQNVTALPQAAIAEYDAEADSWRVDQYWRPRYVTDSARMPLSEYADEYGRRMSRAVAARLDGCQRPGLFLGGGLDCRVVAGAMHKSGRPFSTFTFDLSEADVVCGRQVAGVCGADHHGIAYPEDSQASGLPRVVWRTECAIPFSHSLSIEIHKSIAPHVDWVFNGHFGDTFTRILPNRYVCVNRKRVHAFIMRSCVNLRLPALQRLFRRDFLAEAYPEIGERVARALQEFDEDRPLMLFNLWRGTVRDRRFTFSSPAIDRYAFEQLTPYVDNEVMDWGLQIPVRYLVLERGFKSMVVRNFPGIAAVPLTVNGRPVPGTLVRQFANESLFVGSVLWRKMKRRLSKTKPQAEKGQLDRRLRQAIERFCDSDAFCHDMLDVQAVRDIVAQHFEGREACWREVEVLATLAEGSRLFIEQRNCEPPADVQPVL